MTALHHSNPSAQPPRRVAIVNAGWAGLAAAARAVQAGCEVSVFEASRTPGGRARAVPLPLPGGGQVLADNGQHIPCGRRPFSRGQRKAGEPVKLGVYNAILHS